MRGSQRTEKKYKKEKMAITGEKLNSLIGKGLSIFGGKRLNLIVGVSTTDNCITIMRIIGSDLSTCKVDYIPVDKNLIVRGEWAEIFAEYLPEYIENQHFDKTFAVYLLLPDRLVSTDILTVPTVSASKTEETLQTQINELYTFAPNYKFNKLLLQSNKANTTYELIMLDKDLLNSICKSLSGVKLYVKNCTYAASGALNAVFALRPKTRKQSFLFLDIKAKSARISVCGNGTTIGWSEIPFGLNILSNETILNEQNVVFNDVANIAVLNATETAKKKKKTVIQSAADDNAVIEEAAITVKEMSSDGINEEDAPANTEATNASENADGETARANARTAPLETENATITSDLISDDQDKSKTKKYTRKVAKLPKYMQYSQPQTADEFVVENFRAFVRRCLLIKRQNEQSDYLPVPTFVLVNMPEEYGYVIDEINKDGDNGIEFRFFDPAKEKNPALTSNLELYGAMFTGMYNKVNNF